MTAGEMSGLDEDGNVALSSARRGQIIYNFVMEDPDTDALEGTDPMKAKEWNELEITFTWEAGEATLNTGTVTVSYHPVTDDLTKMTRYASGPTNDVIDDQRLHHDAAVPVRDQPGRLQYRTGHHECLGGIWLLHHRVQRSRCS